MGDDSEPSPRMPHPYMRPGGARFTFKMHETPEPTDEINTKMFMETIVPASDTIPYILYFFHDFCTRCEPYTEKWEELKQVSVINLLSLYCLIVINIMYY